MLRAIVFASLVTMTLAGPTLSADEFPDVTGRWISQAEVMVIDLSNDEPPREAAPTVVFEIDWQDGARFSGIEISHTNADEGALPLIQERVAGVIGPDNDTAVMIDENGSRQCRIESRDRMICVYTHLDERRAVVSRGTWTREVQ